MKTKETPRYTIILIFLISIMVSGCGQGASEVKNSTSDEKPENNEKKVQGYIY